MSEAPKWTSTAGEQATPPGPVLLLCAHGTDNLEGRAVVDALAARVAARGVRVEQTWVDVQYPQVEEVLTGLVGAGERVVVVPALLSAGYHTQVDIAGAVAAHPGRALATAALGPDPRLADLLHRRLVEAGAEPTDAVVLAAAGSSRGEAAEAVREVAALLEQRWGGPVSVGFGAKAEPSVAEAVRAARVGTSGRVVIASYLLAPGFFHDRLVDQGADVVTAPLGVAEELDEIVLARYRSEANL
ncbi:sirohydrochlorin chelatase [Auraticoccus monumenti]|uniref:Sirohydrochlorin ferrochelatase n=1 Tax=Auraticoccus monumenti TaxID=675864 RepID=A0A1G6RY57_9ACTN|nr:CbiX/SirB N-terminal domain-containing protein [Auraticoccus monumenti]SDD09519.1 Sirohydrochlorin ferrochelatase [Auraticoccus monumenti]